MSSDSNLSLKNRPGLVDSLNTEKLSTIIYKKDRRSNTFMRMTLHKPCVSLVETNSMASTISQAKNLLEEILRYIIIVL